MKWLYKSLSPVYYGLQSLRNNMYEKKVLEQVSALCPVVSIGNISFGGTGKTPFVRWLCSQQVLSELNIAVVSRPYKAKFSDRYALVDSKKQLEPEIYGDEACMLASNLPKVDVYVSHSKSDCAVEISSSGKYDLILIDDGFQHRKLRRNIDIVLLDSSVDLKSYRKFPEGNLRESIQGLERADWCVFTKSSSESPSIKNFFNEKSLVDETKNISMGFELGKPTRITPHNSFEMIETEEVSYVLVTGVGNPEQVKSSFKEKFGEALGFVSYQDHHKFSDFDIMHMEKLKEIHKAQYILCTEKDYAKIRNKMKNSSDLYFVPQDYFCFKGEESLVEEIRTLCSKKL